MIPKDPILSLSEAHSFEESYFGGNEDLQWQVMTKAGERVAEAALRDMRNFGPFLTAPESWC